MNEQVVIDEDQRPWNERHHLPLGGEMSQKNMRRFQRAQRNGGKLNSRIKRNKVLRAVGAKAMQKRAIRDARKAGVKI